MAKTKKLEQPKPRVNFPLIVQPRDNGKKTLTLWRQVRESAESIYYPIRKPLIDLFHEIELDTHVSSTIDKRIHAVTNVQWTFMANGEKIPALEPFLKKQAFSKLLKYILESKTHGFSLIEIDLKNNKVELVPREHVLPQYSCVVADPSITSQGIDFTAPPYNRSAIAVGEPDDLGLLYKIAPYVIFKKGDISDWATYCEVFGSPLRVGKYDPAMPGNEAAVGNALKNMGNLAYAALPIGSEFEFVEASKSGSGNNIYQTFADYCNSEISKCIVGQTMTDTNGSSQAQATVHKEILNDINMADRLFVEQILNEKLIPILIAQGFDFPADAQFAPIDEEETLSKKERLEMDLRIHKEVRPLKEDYFAQEYNVEFDEAFPNHQSVPEPVEGKPSKDALHASPVKGKAAMPGGSGTKKNFWDFFQ